MREVNTKNAKEKGKDYRHLKNAFIDRATRHSSETHPLTIFYFRAMTKNLSPSGGNRRHCTTSGVVSPASRNKTSQKDNDNTYYYFIDCD